MALAILPVAIKRKPAAQGGAAPTVGQLLSGEPAYNEATDTLYIGMGDNGSGVATSIIAIAGAGAAVMRTGDQTIAGTKTFSQQINANGGILLGSHINGNNTYRVSNLPDPISPGDAVNKAYADSIASGLSFKDSVRVATTANVTLGSINVGSQIDGVTLAQGDRVLVKNQTTASQNGIYEVSTAGNGLQRAEDFNTSAEARPGSFVFVQDGATQADTAWVLSTNGPITLGTTSLVFTQFASAADIVAGNGLSKSGNTLAVGAGTGIAVGATTVSLTGQALALHNLGTNGIFVRTGSGTVAGRSVAQGTGIAVTNGDGVAGNPTVALTGQALALHNLGTNGLVARTASGAVAARSISTNTGAVTVANADGVAGGPTLNFSGEFTQFFAQTEASMAAGKVILMSLSEGTGWVPGQVDKPAANTTLMVGISSGGQWEPITSISGGTY